jgi:zona occludens toxin (predicted ATPase)
MKKLVLFFFLLTASISLSSFGIISNPKIASQKARSGKMMTINSKSTVRTSILFQNSLVSSNTNEAKQEPQKSFLRNFFGCIVGVFSKIVMTLITK